jgi:large subunit ribosomal protein L22
MQNIRTLNTTGSSTGHYIRISSTKVQRILTQIRGKFYKTALMGLEFMPYKACTLIWKMLYSAYANLIFKLKTKINYNKIIIVSAVANKGPNLKRFRIRAKGQIVSIKKPTCHITIIVKFLE